VRFLPWDGCVNVRDLGGLPTEHGTTTRTGRVVRADDIGALSASGWRALADYGVRTAIDLRFPQERTPHPPHAVPIDVAEIPLFGRIDRATAQRIDALVLDAADAAEAIRLMYVEALEVHATRIAEAVDTVARSLDHGAVLVHCAIGKDRTGIVSAFLLRLAGVSVDDVADDYALSHDRIAGLVAPWIDEAETDEQRRFRERMCSAPRAGMHGMLQALEGRFGGAERYLRDAGVTGERITGLRVALQG
jgi:protein tyrosine/serine phosphatase